MLSLLLFSETFHLPEDQFGGWSHSLRPPRNLRQFLQYSLPGLRSLPAQRRLGHLNKLLLVVNDVRLYKQHGGLARVWLICLSLIRHILVGLRCDVVACINRQTLLAVVKMYM